jgi:hypothetical protein
VRDTNGAVYGVTYKWRADNSDADLLTASLSENIPIITAGGTSTQTWYYPSPSDCLKCHTAAANYVLGIKTRQLNCAFTYPASGTTDNQLRTLNQLGMFYPAIDESTISNLTQMVGITNQNGSLEDRARSYLDANCSQCHRPGGGGPTFDARYDILLTNQNIINAVLTKGNLGYDNAKVVVPHDVWRSVLYDRMNTLDSTIKMPSLARNLIDTNAVAVIAAWIDSLPGTPALAPPAISPASGTFVGLVNITLQPPDTNAALYYTLNGTLPTTNSALYTGPFTLSTTATVSANAFEPGFNNSVAATGLFTIEPNVLFAYPSSFTNGMFQVKLLGQVGKSYILQATTNFTTWVSLNTNVVSSSPFYMLDSGSTNFQYRYYRVIEQP